MNLCHYSAINHPKSLILYLILLSKEEIARYSRHIKIDGVGLEGQEKLKTASVLVIGAGGLGCPVLQYLVAAGVGGIGIVDDDVVDASNLQRQILFDVEDIGKSKASTAIAKLSKQNPFVELVEHAVRLTNENALNIFEGYDIVIDGTDNFPTRYLVNDACVILDKPLVFGSIYKFEGQVSVFNYEGGPSYRCLYPNPPKEGEVPNCSEIGVIGVLPGVIGTRMASECIKIILGIGEVLKGKLLLIDILGNKNLQLNITKNPENWERKVLEENYEDFCGITDLRMEMNEISVKELNERIKAGENLKLVDVREEFEYEICLIPESIKIPLGQISDRSDEIDRLTPTVVICHHGRRSASAIELLKAKGFTNLINLTGGIHSWAIEVDNEMATY